MRKLIAALTCLFAAPSLVSADDKPAASPTKIVKLTLHPAAEAFPALKYQLLPTFYDRQPGNAASSYAKAFILLGQFDKRDERRRELLAGPLEICTPEATADLLPSGALDLARLGALRQHCDWELAYREQSFVELLLPEAQEIRRLSEIFVLQARTQVASGQIEAALASLRTAYAMARHTAESPTLVTGLIGLAQQSSVDKVLLELIQQPGAPNLYWALATLPRPLIEIRPGLEGEMHMLDFSIRGWRELADRTPTDEDAARVFRQYAEILPLIGTDGSSAGKFDGTAVTAFAALRSSVRKQEIKDYVTRGGRTNAEVEKLSDFQLAIVYSRLKHDEIRDHLFRWMAMPYPQAAAGLAAADARLKQAVSGGEELIPIATLLLPAVHQARLTHACGERRLDVLRLIEALRMFAAAHDGKLPQSLDELQATTPVPVDAITGKPFDYKLEGGKARLTLTNERLDGATGTLVYEISLASQRR